MNYKEKLRLAKEALDSGSYDKETIEYIFPELKESEIKSCLRPLSSMTDEEKIELYEKAGFYYRSSFELETDEFMSFSDAISENKLFLPYPIWGDDLIKIYDWLNEHNYDYRGLNK